MKEHTQHSPERRQENCVSIAPARVSAVIPELKVGAASLALENRGKART